MSEDAWKRAERRTAAVVGAKRRANSGSGQEDLMHPLFSFEHKLRKSLPDWLLGAVAQARRNAEESKVPIVILTTSRQGVRTTRLFVMDEAAWLDLHGG